MSIASSIEHIIPRLYVSSKPFAPIPRALSLLRAQRRFFFRSLSSPIAASVDSTTTKDYAGTPSTDDDTLVFVASERSLVDVNPPRGTRDFPPEDMRLRNWLFNNFREVSRLLSFEEVDFPVLESEALFIRKGGEEITQQLYNFEDKGGRRVVLRPEITPSLARLVIKQGFEMSINHLGRI